MPSQVDSYTTASATSPPTHRHHAQRSRRGVAAVEFAIVFPLFLLLVFGAIGIGRAIVVQHKLVEAARAGCRLYSVRDDADEQKVRAMIDSIMADADLDGYSVEFDPYPPSAIEHVGLVRVSVSIPYDQVSWFAGGQFLAGKTLSGTCIMPGDTGEIFAGNF